ncbi:uncharacterized protein EI97DRAFT_11927 [Westerdykella ornata]|uniref:Uncharacterized protein n=1 Tax=Westerdykella ornata TaxID=318751 RepID=A0A6A6JWA2_WESOR|nr:uncharacterized protein EI97DRAFT_11927 [Westerdykella ornata]KAF2280882.1 hypothetical protein EI97DRAFT_11927 [Westerdykella ornata]
MHDDQLMSHAAPMCVLLGERPTIDLVFPAFARRADDLCFHLFSFTLHISTKAIPFPCHTPANEFSPFCMRESLVMDYFGQLKRFTGKSGGCSHIDGVYEAFLTDPFGVCTGRGLIFRAMGWYRPPWWKRLVYAVQQVSTLYDLGMGIKQKHSDGMD